jgi:metal-sulfur cluster biosynthetic enzyme
MLIQEVLNKVAGLEQFLLRQKMYIAAALFYRLYHFIANRDFVEKLSLSSIPEEIRSWEEAERIIKELPALIEAALAEIPDTTPAQRNWLFFQWCEALAAAYLQMRFSRDGAPALQNYLAYRAQEMTPRSRPYIYSAWEWWRYLKDLAEAIVSALEEIDKNFGEIYNIYRRNAGVRDISLSNRVLDFVLDYDPPREYEERFDILSFDSFRMIRRWAASNVQDFYQGAAATLLEEVQRQVRTILSGVSIFPPKIFIQASPEWDTDRLAQEAKENISETVNIQPLGLAVGAAEVHISVVIDEKERVFERYYLILSPTAEVGRKIMEILANWQTEFNSQQVGDSLAFTAFTENGFRQVLSSVGVYIELAFAELLRRHLIQPEDDQTRLEFLKELQESGLLQRIPMLSHAIEWLQDVAFSPDREEKNWRAVEQFLRGYFDRQSEDPVTVESVRIVVREWVEKAREMLRKYGNLKYPPEDLNEARQFGKDVREFTIETERMLSMLHGAGGMLTRLTLSGTYTNLFDLLRLREGIGLVEAAYRYGLYEGDKKLLLKWLILQRMLLKS